MTDAWPDADELCRGLRAALAGNDPAAAIDWAGELLVAVDRAIGGQVVALFANPRFAQLEVAWRAVADLASAAGESPAAVVQVVDLAADELSSAGDWLDRTLYAGPLDTRGGVPVGLLAIGDVGAGPPELATLAGRALCPVLIAATATAPPGPGPFVFPVASSALLRPPLSADPAWAGWFGWSEDDDLPLSGGGAQAMAADVVRSVVVVGWPVGLAHQDPDLPRLLVAARFGHLAAVRCRASGGRSPDAVAAEIADGLRGRYVGPRLPLRWVDVAAGAVTGGRLACTLRLAPRLGGDDPDEVPVTVCIVVSAP